MTDQKICKQKGHMQNHKYNKTKQQTNTPTYRFGNDDEQAHTRGGHLFQKKKRKFPNSIFLFLKTAYTYGLRARAVSGQ